MVSVNALTREIHLKIVYYGPGLGGKTTTLQYIHDTTDPNHRGKMVSLATPVERTLYFDYLPVRLPEIGGYALKLQLFTVPGQIHFNATRKLVLSNADGVVFVADSQRSRLEADLESYDNLLFNLADYKIDTDTFPIIFQYNKRDLIDIVPLSELETELNRTGRPSLGTCAVKGMNVYEGLELITKEVLRTLKRRGVTDETPASQRPTAAPKGVTEMVAAAAAASSNIPADPKSAPKKAPRERLPLEAAVSNMADRSRRNEPTQKTSKSGAASGPVRKKEQRDFAPVHVDRPTIPAPFALSEKAEAEHARVRRIIAGRTKTTAGSVAMPTGTATRFTFVPLWPESAKKRGMEIETAVCERRYLEAIRLILAEMDLIITMHRRGRQTRSAETVLALLDLDGARYREIADLATVPAVEVSLSSVLSAYLFLLQLIEKSR